MNYILLIGILAVIVFVYFKSRGQARETLKKGEEEILRGDIDGYMDRKQAFNHMQEPGQAGDSVELKSYNRKNKKKGGAE